jgi:pilus assembly protein CpaB
MNTARIVVLTVAAGAGGIAAHPASGSDNNRPRPFGPVAQLPTLAVLAERSDIGPGQPVEPVNVRWQTRPPATASAPFIRRNERPDAHEGRAIDAARTARALQSFATASRAR